MRRSVRLLVYAIFLYTCVEGLVISVYYPAKLPFVYKDLALVVVYVVTFAPSPARLFAATPSVRPFVLPAVAFTLCLGVYLAVSADILAALVAVKQRVFYVPLISIGALFVRSPKDLERLFVPLAVCAVAVSAFGVYLYVVGREGLEALGANYFGDVYTAWSGPDSEPYWRVPGTFTSPGQYGAYLLFSGLVAIALAMNATSRRARLLAAAAVGMTLLAILVSGSRTPLVLLAGAVALLVLLSRAVTRLTAVVLVAVVVLAYAFSFLGAGVRERFASIAAYEHVERFQRTYFGQLFLPELLEEPLGSGLGTATIGARHVSELRDVELVESYLGILAVETGLPGVASFLWLAAAIGAAVLRQRRMMRGQPDAVLWHALAVYVLFTLLILPVSTVIDHAPSNLYFWFSVGALLRVADLTRSEPAAPPRPGRGRRRAVR